jgi:flagellar biosynthesis/type III secretory pathway protein FliH
MFEGAGRSLRRESEKRGREQGLKEGIQQGRREGILQGKEEAVLENVRTLSARLHLSAEQAMDALDIPPEEREGIRKKLLPSS